MTVFYSYVACFVNTFTLSMYVTEIPLVSPGTPSATPRLPSGIPHPVVGHASVGARASCPLPHRTRVRTARRGPARRGCHSCDVYVQYACRIQGQTCPVRLSKPKQVFIFKLY